MRYLILLPLIVLALLPGIAEAHFLKTDQSIGVVLHIDPNDDPIAGEPATFIAEITDRNHKFQAANCTCNLLIKQNSTQIANLTMAVADSVTTSAISQFDSKGVYQVIISGTPISTNGFQPFSVTYDIRVDKDSTSAAASSNLLTDILAGVVIVIVGVVTFFLVWRSRKNA